jgi:DNA-directed RNA polymerase specialized sigma24 family protein
LKAEEYLLQIGDAERKIENKIAELQRIEAMAENISPKISEVSVTSTHNPHRLQDVWTRLVCSQNELLDDIVSLTDLKAEVTRTLEKLPREEYDVLYRIYILGQSVEHIAIEMHYSRPTIYKYKDKGLTDLQKILDEHERV